MSRGRGQQDRRRSGGPWLALATVLLIAAGLAVWSLSVRDRAAPAEPAGSSSAVAPTPPPPVPSTAASPTAAADVLTADALLTPADVATVGLTVADPVGLAEPAFPVLCDAPDWGTEWSAPVQGVGSEYPTQGARVTEYATGYADDAAASAALGRLVADASRCPDVAAGGSVESAGPAAAVDGESAVFVTAGSGRDGIAAVTWSVVVRSGQTLLLTSYATPQQIGTGADGDDSAGGSAGARTTAEALAQAALDRFTAPA